MLGLSLRCKLRLVLLSNVSKNRQFLPVHVRRKTLKVKNTSIRFLRSIKSFKQAYVGSTTEMHFIILFFLKTSSLMYFELFR